MSAKHFLNDPTHLVTTSLHALTLTNPSLALDSPNKIIYRRPNHSPRQVSVLSGGGAGHEPSFAAMVGQGLLSAAVSGTIFASPSSEQIRTAVQSRVDTTRGVLVTVMNYTGDVLNFGVAVEKARAAGVEVEMVVVGDDVGVGREKAGKVGRRGIAGTVLVHKISGALAAMGRPLSEVVKVARLTAENLVSVGASLEHVHVPGRAPPSTESEDTLKNGEVELGMGIHNEPGSGRAVLELPELVRRMLEQLLDPNDRDRAFLEVNSNEVVLLVNNLGGVSPLEMGGITAEVCAQLESSYRIRPVRVLCGTYMTSLNGLGFSITLLNVVNTDIGGPGMIELLDAPCEATGWSTPVRKETWEAGNKCERTDGVDYSGKSVKPSGLAWDAEAGRKALVSALERVISAEPEITRYDTIVGDGDCGTGLKRGAEAILKHISETPFTGDLVVDLAAIVPVVETTMDGTSGALFSIFLNSLVHALRATGAVNATPSIWAAALKQSMAALGRYTPARPGDRTLVDALQPFVDTLSVTGDAEKAARGARMGAERTRGMVPGLGRSVYVGGDGYKKVPDPGAWGVACFFLGLVGGEVSEEGWEAI